MPAPLHIVLTPEEERTLSELRVARSVSQRTRDRAHVLRLNAQGWTVPAIAEIFECQENTVRQALSRWQQDGLVDYGMPLDGEPRPNGKKQISSIWNNAWSKNPEPITVNS